jgi:hypothetical protein
VAVEVMFVGAALAVVVAGAAEVAAGLSALVLDVSLESIRIYNFPPGSFSKAKIRQSS